MLKIFSVDDSEVNQGELETNFNKLIETEEPAFLQKGQFGQRYFPGTQTLCVHQLACEYSEDSLRLGTYRFLVLAHFKYDKQTNTLEQLSLQRVSFDTVTGTHLPINPESRSSKVKFYSSFPLVKKRLFSVCLPTYGKLVCVVHCFWLGKWILTGKQETIRQPSLTQKELHPNNADSYTNRPVAGVKLSGTSNNALTCRDTNDNRHLWTSEIKKSTVTGWEYTFYRLVLR